MGVGAQSGFGAIATRSDTRRPYVFLLPLHPRNYVVPPGSAIPRRYCLSNSAGLDDGVYHGEPLGAIDDET